MPNHSLISLHVVPRASKNQIVGWVDDGKGGRALKVKVKAPPEGGKANAELINFLAKQWNMPKSALTISGGASSRRKQLKIHGNIIPLEAGGQYS